MNVPRPGSRRPQILVNGLSAYPIGASQISLWDARIRLLTQFVGFVGAQGLLAPLVRPTQLGEGDAFALSFTNQVALESRKSCKHRKHESRHRVGSVATERELILHEIDRDPAFG